MPVLWRPKPYIRVQSQRYPQPTYPADLFDPLISSLRRRSYDGNHLPSLRAQINSPDSFHDWGILENHVDDLLWALKGQSRNRQFDIANSDSYGRDLMGCRPALEPGLRSRVEDMLGEIEREAVQLGRDIGM